MQYSSLEYNSLTLHCSTATSICYHLSRVKRACDMKQNLSLKNATQLQLKQMREIPSWSFATYRVREEWSLCDKGFCHRIRKDWGRKRRCVRSTSGQIVDHRWNRALTKPPLLGGLLFHYVQGDTRHKNPTGEQQYTYSCWGRDPRHWIHMRTLAELRTLFTLMRVRLTNEKSAWISSNCRKYFLWVKEIILGLMMALFYFYDYLGRRKK